jgi:hypothetical protein
MVEMATVLFIPDRFMDYRMWSDVPDRIRVRAEAIHYDQHELVPWNSVDGGFLDAARRLAADRGFAVVAAAGQAARFGFAVAEAGLAKGLVLFYPSLDRVLPEMVADLESADLSEELAPFVPIANALSEPDPARRRDIYLQVVRDIVGPGLDPAEVELAMAMASDHADEFFANLQAVAAAGISGPLPDPPWMERPWIDRLADLNVPVMAVVGPRAHRYGEAIAARAKNAEIIVSEGSPGLAPVGERIRTAQILVRMLERIS